MKLTTDHLEMLREAERVGPILGFPMGSNLWPLTTYEHRIDGEIIDELLRDGLLIATPSGTTIAGQRSPNHDIAPDLDFEHVISITPAGRTALGADNAD